MTPIEDVIRRGMTDALKYCHDHQVVDEEQCFNIILEHITRYVQEYLHTP